MAPSTITTSPRWATIAEAAVHYRVSDRTVRRRVADGTLRARKFGPRLIRVRIEDEA